MVAKPKIFLPPLDLQNGVIDMTHGSGGLAMSQLIESLFARRFDNAILAEQNDFAVFATPTNRIVMSTDSYVISPIFFPGGDIGSLAVNGTVNDIAMSGAKPLYLSAGFILEEGFALASLEKVAISMAEAAKKAGVKIITGDTKVVERGKGDGIFINTAGVGCLPENVDIAGKNARVGDAIIVSGTIGDHGVAVMASRENLEFETSIESDCAALNGLVSHMVESFSGIHCLRDPTRGGLATTLNELARQSGVGMRIYENRIPINDAVAGACELLGLDPLQIANEGKLVCICAGRDAENLVTAMRRYPEGKDAAIIGEVVEDAFCTVQMETRLGGRRIVDWLVGEPLPRIC